MHLQLFYQVETCIASHDLRLQWCHKEPDSQYRVLRQQVGCEGGDQLSGALAVWPSRMGHASAVGMLEHVRALLTMGSPPAGEAATILSACLFMSKRFLLTSALPPSMEQHCHTAVEIWTSSDLFALSDHPPGGAARVISER